MDASSRQHYDPASSGLFRINPDRETELKHMLRVLWRRRLLLLACVVLAAGSVWGITARMTPIFSATAAVMLESYHRLLTRMERRGWQQRSPRMRLSRPEKLAIGIVHGLL